MDLSIYLLTPEMKHRTASKSTATSALTINVSLLNTHLLHFSRHGVLDSVTACVLLRSFVEEVEHGPKVNSDRHNHDLDHHMDTVIFHTKNCQIKHI